MKPCLKNDEDDDDDDDYYYYYDVIWERCLS